MLGLFLFAALNILAHQTEANYLADEREQDEREESFGFYERNYVTDQGVQMICDSMRESYAVSARIVSFVRALCGSCVV